MFVRKIKIFHEFFKIVLSLASFLKTMAMATSNAIYDLIFKETKHLFVFIVVT